MMSENVQALRVFYTNFRRNRVWDLSKGTSGVVLAGGLTGQHFPEFDTVRTEPARMHGSIYRTTRFKSRKVGLKVLVGDPLWVPKPRRGAQWRDLDDLWNSDLSEVDPGRLTFVTNHGFRWLDVRVEGADDPESVSEPGKSGMVKYGYTMGADKAFYSGFPLRYTIAEHAKGVQSGEVWNVGQYDTYPVVKFHGPGTYTFGQPGRWTKLPALQVGEWLEIDTDPNRKTIVDQAGRNRRGELPRDHDLSFVLPAGECAVLHATVANGSLFSKVEATVTPMYRRAW
ncbi:minor tail protein [Gordonia phage Catfish]|uniref:Minor tail protein n=1 Tax=Gordonia phage Catfish TaxID=2301538 RepID=A0A385D0K3_9CAUD|nr:minor tail protein [Gordonia phage Catfish]AXQ51858.1 minor tail protein [Gordonia phage Catfish]